MFCYLDFCSYLDRNRLHFLLRVLLPFKFMAKITYRLLKQALKKQPDRNKTKARLTLRKSSLSVAWKPNCDDVKADTDQTRASRIFLALLGINLSRRKLNQHSQTVGCSFGSNAWDERLPSVLRNLIRYNRQFLGGKQ